MMQDLTPDIIGTNPKYPSIVNHEWLTPQAYDNYPSDNNSVRVLPKLADLWGLSQSSGINLVPNLTVQHTGADEDPTSNVVGPVVREAKKAIMAGLKGKELTSHLRARFSKDHIVQAKDSLAALASEQGLLGTVYIDASAFTSGKEAEQFLTAHRTRLAQDIVVNESKLTPPVIELLASKFHKNVVASINYNENLFQKYRMHLLASGKISRDFVIDSKETLRQAFLSDLKTPEPTKIVAEEEKPTKPIAAEDLQFLADKVAAFKTLAAEELLYREAKPIIEYACQRMADGKVGADLKEMLRKKYAKEDLNKAAKYLALVISGDLNPNTIDGLVAEKKISEYIGEELKRFGRKYPRKAVDYKPEDRGRPVAVKGFLYPLSGSKSSNEHCKEAVEALRKGATLDSVRESLLTKFSATEAEQILSDSINEFNLAPIGTKANVSVREPKKDIEF